MIHNDHFQAALAQFGSSGIAIISFMILARTMSQETFGEWGLFLAISSFIDLLKSGFVATGTIKYSSGKSDQNKSKYIAASWVLHILTVLIISTLLLSIYSTHFFEMDSVVLFLLYYPIFAVVSMPYHHCIWKSQMDIKIYRIAGIKLLNASLFLLVCIGSIYRRLTLEEIVWLYLLCFAISSFVALALRMTGLRYIDRIEKERFVELLIYGRFHTLVFLGSNLLRGSDTFLISAFLGPRALAIYLIPQRLWSLVVLPLASAMTVAFPLFSSDHNSGNLMRLTQNIEKYIGALTLFYIPFAIVLFFFSETLVSIVGGEKYLGATVLFQIFLVYSIVVPTDQVLGVSLDAIDLPNKNFIKVTIMAVVNIVGDATVLYFFQDITYVAWVTLGTSFSGAIAGYVMLRKEIPIQLSSSMKEGYCTLKDGVGKLIAQVKFLKSKEG